MSKDWLAWADAARHAADGDDWAAATFIYGQLMGLRIATDDARLQALLDASFKLYREHSAPEWRTKGAV